MITRRLVLCVLAVWLALPAARLACAASCAPAPEWAATPVASHCHEAPAEPAADATVRPGHACSDAGKLAVGQAILKNRQTTASPVASGTAAFALATIDPLQPIAGSRAVRLERPPDLLLVPLRL